ncbi:MAG: hypothetical protein HZA16_03815 [Nitrospirae bacterium]|nr:hypothetical protein [Nitrospirota bacterium]
MNEEFNQRFSEEVNRYKNALLFCAKQCEWETFKVNAGRLFDYVESIEMSETERRFFNISKIVVFILCIVVLFILKMNLIIISPAIARIRELITIAAVGIGCFEMYFFFNFRMYMKAKKSFYKKRRERFISDIEKDFKDIITQA